MNTANRTTISDPAWYALRRTLPPWRFRDNLRELVRQLPRYRVNEVIVKVDTEEFSHGQPPLEWIRAYQPRLLEIRDTLKTIGVRYSLNPWITVGHNDRGRDATAALPGLGTVVGHDGTVCRVCACPLSEVWRDHIRKVWTIYAETRPFVIWIEDDIRTFNHRPVRYGCFCRSHLRAFSERVGRDVSREELVAALLQPGPPHPWRGLFLEMQAAIMEDTVRFLEQVVHAISPETSLGLMSSGPRIHCLEGRRWTRMAEAMAGGRPFFSRPPLGNYNEDSLRGLYYSHDSIKLTRHVLPAGTIEQTEVENWPFTGYSKSVAFTRLQMALSFAYGAHGVTLNLYDHAGTPMEAEPAIGRMLGESKAWFKALASRAQASGRYRGVRLLHHERASAVKQLPEGAEWWALREDGEEAMRGLEGHGIPTTYESEEPAAMATGQTLRAFSEAEVESLLKRGLFLDAVAARVLIERGMGDAIGLAGAEPPVWLDELGAFSAEEFVHRPWGGRDRTYLTLTLPDLSGRPHVSVLTPMESAAVTSWLVDPDTRRLLPGMIAFENRWGGRVVVHALDWASACGPSFFHPFRRQQLQGAFRWLARGQLPVLVNGGVFPLGVRKDTEEGTLLGLFNLSLDPWPEVVWTLGDIARRPAGVERLERNGRWRKTTSVLVTRKGPFLTICLPGPVTYDEPAFVMLRP
jgi:hypothetical protein